MQSEIAKKIALKGGIEMRFKTLAVSGFLAAAMAAMAAPAANDGDGLGLIKAIRGNASDIEEQTALLERMGTAASRESYICALDAVKADINRMGKAFARLEGIEESVTPEERAVIERAEPLLKDIAENTRTSIAYVNSHAERLWAPNNQARIAKIESASDQLYGLLGPFESYTKVSAKEKRLEKVVETGM
jgi:hypothetical protein